MKKVNLWFPMGCFDAQGLGLFRVSGCASESFVLPCPEGPSTQIVGFRSPNPYSEWFLDLETLLFGYLNPKPKTQNPKPKTQTPKPKTLNPKT